MIRFWKRLWSSENGQARLPSPGGQALTIVLALLAIGGLTIAVSLNYATTSLKGSRIVEEKTDGVYAAGAGVEYALWSLQKGLWSIPVGTTTNTTTPDEYINQMAVSIQAQNKGTKTLVLTGWTTFTQSQQQTENWRWISITKNITWNGTAQAYRYTVNVTWQGDEAQPKEFINGLGVKIPAGFSYKSPPAPSGMSTLAPAISGNISTGHIFEWSWSGGDRPFLWPNQSITVLTQTFYITGSGSTAGSYAWATAGSANIGTVGEMTGTLYKITATATRPQDGRTTAQIVADMMLMGGTTYIVSWQITN